MAEGIWAHSRASIAGSIETVEPAEGVFRHIGVTYGVGSRRAKTRALLW